LVIDERRSGGINANVDARLSRQGQKALVLATTDTETSGDETEDPAASREGMRRSVVADGGPAPRLQRPVEPEGDSS
jgi:hypothetical protein